MPTYSYKCPKDNCGEEENDVFHKLAEAGPNCPKHKRTPMVKKLSAPAFALKGGCWEKDGYASKKTGSSGSIDAKEFGEGLMNAASEGAKAGGHKEGERRVKEYQRKQEKSAGG